MKIGDEVYVRGYVDEIRQDTVIIRNDGGYFGTAPSEVVEKEETLQNLTKPNKRTDKRTETHACDLISRQAAIDAVGKAMPQLTTPDGCGEFDHEIQIADEAFSDCMKIINDLPSAQPFTEEQIQTMQELEAAQIEKAYELGKADRLKWIPLNAKGREPEVNGEYLLQLSDGFITTTYYDGKDWELWADAGEPIAWMPLPEAYREDGEEE